MKILGTNVLIKKEKPEYSGILQGIDSDENTYAKILDIGFECYKIDLTDVSKLALVDWNKAKKIKNDLYVILDEDIIAILEDGDLVND